MNCYLVLVLKVCFDYFQYLSFISSLLFSLENKSSVVPKPTTTTTTTKSTTKASTLPLDDDDDFLSKRPGKKNSKPVADDIFDDVQSKGEPVNKAKKDWAIMNKSDGTG
jgi:hypothetical protein